MGPQLPYIRLQCRQAGNFLGRETVVRRPPLYEEIVGLCLPDDDPSRRRRANRRQIILINHNVAPFLSKCFPCLNPAIAEMVPSASKNFRYVVQPRNRNDTMTLNGGRRMPGSQTNGELRDGRSEEHTSELQSLMRISYAVFCLKKKKKFITHTH